MAAGVLGPGCGIIRAVLPPCRAGLFARGGARAAAERRPAASHGVCVRVRVRVHGLDAGRRRSAGLLRPPPPPQAMRQMYPGTDGSGSRLEEFTTTRNEAEKLKAKWAAEKKKEVRADEDRACV